MAPRESDPLLLAGDDKPKHRSLFSFEDDIDDNNSSSPLKPKKNRTIGTLLVVLLVVIAASWGWYLLSSTSSESSASSLFSLRRATGPYKLIQRQVGQNFFDYYDFYEGMDSLGSAGYQTYIGKERAFDLNLANVTSTTTDTTKTEDFVFMQSIAGKDGGFRESVRLEGKTRFNRGLFILDVEHMPSGCGVWPAFWMTDEDNWPDNGEIDIVEGINTQSIVKTALHSSESCSMFAHVPSYAHTGVWDTATGLPDTFTGIPNTMNHVEADNCWVQAPHQWGNQGCVAVSTDNGTIGEPMNEIGGGIYVLEWDPVAGYIRSWVFKRNDIPTNLQASLDGSSGDTSTTVVPNPSEWPLPYAYFAIGDGSGCSNDHFKQMRLVFNLAFCGTVAGNRFFKDCPNLSRQFNVSNDSVKTCNAFLASEPESLLEAYWKIRGVYVYEREFERQSSSSSSSHSSTISN